MSETHCSKHERCIWEITLSSVADQKDLALKKLWEAEAQMAKLNEELKWRRGVHAVTGEVEKLKAELEQAKRQVADSRTFYLTRMERLTQLLKPTPLWHDVACILANGTASSNEPPTYAIEMNTLRHELKHEREVIDRYREALENAKEALMDGSGAGVFWRESAVERINKALLGDSEGKVN